MCINHQHTRLAGHGSTKSHVATHPLSLDSALKISQLQQINPTLGLLDSLSHRISNKERFGPRPRPLLWSLDLLRARLLLAGCFLYLRLYLGHRAHAHSKSGVSFWRSTALNPSLRDRLGSASVTEGSREEEEPSPAEIKVSPISSGGTQVRRKQCKEIQSLLAPRERTYARRQNDAAQTVLAFPGSKALQI